jgi:hypothetical protein
MRRPMLVTAGAVALLLLSAAIAFAAKPVAGSWTGTKSLDFTVNQAGTKVTNFTPGGCAAGPVPWTFKVKSNGAFFLKKKISLEGGGPVTMKITGKFTTPTSARGSISYGKCRQKFKATGKLPEAEPPQSTEPVSSPDDY